MMTEPIEKFWMVCGVNRSAPNHRHASKSSAQTEARRLSKRCPGELFVVLAAVDAFVAVVPEPEVVRLTKPKQHGGGISDDGIPF